MLRDKSLRRRVSPVRSKRHVLPCCRVPPFRAGFHYTTCYRFEQVRRSSSLAMVSVGSLPAKCRQFFDLVPIKEKLLCTRKPGGTCGRMSEAAVVPWPAWLHQVYGAKEHPSPRVVLMMSSSERRTRRHLPNPREIKEEEEAFWRTHDTCYDIQPYRSCIPFTSP